MTYIKAGKKEKAKIFLNAVIEKEKEFLEKYYIIQEGTMLQRFQNALKMT